VGGIRETNYLLSSPRNAERLLSSTRQIEAGEGRVFATTEELDAARREAVEGGGT